MSNLLVREDIINAIDSIRDRMKYPEHFFWALEDGVIRKHAAYHGILDELVKDVPGQRKRIIDNEMIVTIREKGTGKITEQYPAYFMFIYINNEDTGVELMQIIVRHADHNRDAINWLKDVMGKDALSVKRQLNSLEFEDRRKDRDHSKKFKSRKSLEQEEQDREADEEIRRQKR